MNKTKKAFHIIIFLLLVLALTSCGSTEKTQSNYSSTQTSAGKSSSKNNAEYASQKSTSTSKSDSYSYKASTGEKLEAKPGYTAVLDTVSSSPVSEHSPSVLLPFIGDYVSGPVDVGTEIPLNDGTYETFFGFSEKKDKENILKYIDALSTYGCTLEKKTGAYYYLNCSENISHGKIPYDYLTTYYDLQISINLDKAPYYVLVVYPPEIWFDYSSLSGTQSGVSITVMSSVRYSSDKYYFDIKGYAGEKDELTICFDPETYSSGKTISLKDLKAQEAAGSSSLCKIWIESSSGYLKYDDVYDANINILDATDSTAAISFSITYLDGTTKHTVEGVSVSKEVEESIANSGDAGITPISPATGNDVCSYCGGTGETICHTCGGSGTVMCPNCNGTGSYWENGVGTTPGSVKKCTRCNHGKIKCSNSKCHGGMVPCTACGGDGIR